MKVSTKQWFGIPEKSDPKRWFEIRRKRFGRLFIRHNKNGTGFQMLIFGCMWINVLYTDCDPKSMDSHLFSSGGVEWINGASVLWSEIGTMSFIKE